MEPFNGKKLAEAMTAAGMNMSNVAAVAWGTTTDKRGVKVARNRDRIRHYLAGGSATHENFAKVAAALNVSVDDLRATPPAKPAMDAKPAKPATSIILPIPGGGSIEITVTIKAPHTKAW